MRNVGQIDGKDVVITNHALTRLLEMKLSPEDIRELIVNPDEVYYSTKYQGDFCHRKGEYALAFCKEGDLLIVKTALYGTLAAWLKARKDGSLPEGRDVKLNIGIPRF